MGQGGQGKPAVGKTHPFSIVGKHLVCCLDDISLCLLQRLTSFLDALMHNDPVDLRHVPPLRSDEDGNFIPNLNLESVRGSYLKVI